MNARRKAARAQILRAAADLFRERGYQASTVEHIAARLGMSKASLYTHFRAKEEMLAAISRETIEAFTRDLDLVLGSRLDPEEKLRRMVRQHVRFVIANRSFLTVFFGEEANLPAALRALPGRPEGPLRQGGRAHRGGGVRARGVPRRAAAAGGLRRCSAWSTGSTSGTTRPAAGAPRRSRPRSSP